MEDFTERRIGELEAYAESLRSSFTGELTHSGKVLREALGEIRRLRAKLYELAAKENGR